MKVGLIDVDGKNYPNLALMKISAYHKSNGDICEWAVIGHYDVIYMSKIFTFSKDYDLGLISADTIIRGGTGYNYNKLIPEAEYIHPDYSLYPRFQEAYGFLTRGCPNECSWCVVPEKEGRIRSYMNIEDIIGNRKIAVLMDNNVLAHSHGIRQIEKIGELGIKIDFNQGLDARLIDEGIAKRLGIVKFYKPLRMACDTISQMPYIEKATKLLRKHNVTRKRYFVYVLVKDIQDALERVEFLRGLNLDPFAQPYRNLTTGELIDYEHKRFARWVNRKELFNSVKWEDYTG